MRSGGILGGIIAAVLAAFLAATALGSPASGEPGLVPAAPGSTAGGQLLLDPRPVAQIAQRGDDVLRTKGYEGLRKVPKTRPAAPPAPLTIGEGEHPDVLVDAAGTSHIVWNEDVNPPAPDITHYCRILRGATGCDNPNGTPMPIGIEYASDDAGPKIFQLGDQLVVLTHRYPPVTRHPDGQDRDRTTYAWTSSDGGTTWTGPGIVGTVLPSGDAALVGTATEPRIAVVTASFTGGTYLQMIDAGSFTASETLIGPGDQAYDGTVAADGAGVVTAFADLSGNVLVRRAADSEATLDPAAFSSATVSGAELPRLASGPSGAFLMTQTTAGDGRWQVQGVTGGQPQRPTTISARDGDITATRDLFADPSGRLHAAWVDETDRQSVLLRTSPDGRSWSGAFPIARAKAIDDLALASAADGGGVLIHRRDPTGTFRGTIAATAFGTLEPTGQLGAGSLAGSGIPGGFAGCKSAGFGDVELIPAAGCLLESAEPGLRGALVSRSEVDFGGLILEPDADVSIVFDPRKRTLDTVGGTGKVRVLLRGPGIGEIEIAHVELHAELNDSEGQSLFKGLSLPKGPSIKGFPIDADFDVKIAKGGVTIPLSLKLPPAMANLSASATLVARSGSGAELESFRITAGSLPLGPVTLGQLDISYDGTAERWTGTMDLTLPVGALKATVVFENGAFVRGTFELRPPRPGILVFKETYFTGVTGGLTLDPFSVEAGASFGFVYHPPPADVFLGEVDGRLKLTIREDVAELNFTGSGKLYGATVGTWDALLTTDGYVRIKGGYDLDLEVVGLEGSLQAFFDAPTTRFGASFESTIRLVGIPITGGRGAMNNDGVGACVTAPPLPPETFEQTEAGVFYEFGGDVHVLFGETCGLERYVQAAAPRGASFRQAPGGRAFSLGGGHEWANIEVRGDGGPPLVDVIAPDGRRVTPLAPGEPGGDPQIGAVSLDGGTSTVIVLDDPAAGTWQVVPREGSPAITDVLVAESTPPLKVSGKVRGQGANRTLRYDVQAPGGTTIRFIEQGTGGERELGSTTSAKGRLKIAPFGTAGRRTIVAVPEREGLPGAPEQVTTYRAPGAKRLAAPKGVKARGKTVRWRAVPGAVGYVVTARLADGRTVAVQVDGKARQAKVEGRVRRASVAARAATGAMGRAGRSRG